MRFTTLSTLKIAVTWDLVVFSDKSSARLISCTEMLYRAAGFTTTPDLILSDYRLRDDENGITTIERLRTEFNNDIPAILITGDTAPDRIREATASDCFLMHKPVSNSRLRAAIVNLADQQS